MEVFSCPPARRSSMRGHGNSYRAEVRLTLMSWFVIKMTLGSAKPHSPPRRGGEAAPSLRSAQTGWSEWQAVDFAELLLRLRASLEAARYRACASRGLALRASPPLRGGERA